MSVLDMTPRGKATDVSQWYGIYHRFIANQKSSYIDHGGIPIGFVPAANRGVTQ